MRLAEGLAARGAEAIVLGCTELPLVADDAPTGDGPAGDGRSAPWVGCTEALASAVVAVATDSDALRPNP